MPHDHRIQNGELFIGKLILTQFSQSHIGLQHDLPAGRNQVATQNFHKRGLAAAIRSNQTVAFAFGKFNGHIFKQRFGSELHGEISGGNHGRLDTGSQ